MARDAEMVRTGDRDRRHAKLRHHGAGHRRPGLDRGEG